MNLPSSARNADLSVPCIRVSRFYPKSQFIPSNRTLRVAATFTRLHSGHGFDSKEDLSKPELQEPVATSLHIDGVT